MIRRAILSVIFFAIAVGCSAPASSEAILTGDLPRKGDHPLEQTEGVQTIYSTFQTSPGFRVRTITTLPNDATGRLAAVLFVQWLSCDSVEINPRDSSGWSNVIRGLVRTPGFIVQRTEKPGVGDSEGPECSALDYDTELSVHREALDRLLADPRVDPARVFIVGMSMGSNMVPLLAAERPVAGVAIWGGGAHTWFERQLNFERRAMELGGVDPRQYAERMAKTAEFYSLYLLKGLSPPDIAGRQPTLGKVWAEFITGAEGGLHFGRPTTFHRQAQQKNWAGAWSKITAPVLVLFGEFDWYEDVASAQLVVDIVNRSAAGRARLEIVPATDHHFLRFETRQAAFDGRGVENSAPAIAVLTDFLVSRSRGERD